jgi:hypothetical protein
MNRFPSTNRLRPGRAALLAVLLGALTGCGSGQGEVSGTVRCNGKLLPFGTIHFLGCDGIPRAGQIQPDGTFCVGVPAGEAKVIVSCLDEGRMNAFGRSTAGRGRSAPPILSGQSFSLIPLRYADWNASGLTVVVKRGKTRQDFALTSSGAGS